MKDRVAVSARRCPTCDEPIAFGSDACERHGLGAVARDADLGDELLPAGAPVGEYSVVELVGAGGFGAVYRATHPVIGKVVAIKVLLRRHSADPAVVRRFISEARAVNLIHHPNIVDVFGFGALPDGRHFMVMEFLEGESLEDVIQRRGALPPAQGLGILRQVGAALHAAHGAGVVHRDVKPANILLVEHGDGAPTAKLLDFGIAKLAPVGAAPEDTGSIQGTPYFMSPEQIGGLAVDARSDIYAFGVLAFVVLSGQLPFDGQSSIDVLFKHRYDSAPSLSAVAPYLPAALDAPIARMLAKSADARFASMAEALEALLEAAQGAGLPPESVGSDAAGTRPVPSEPRHRPLATDPTLRWAPPAASAAPPAASAVPRRAGAAYVAVAVSAVGLVGVLALRGGGGGASQGAPQRAAAPALSPLVPAASSAVVVLPPPSASAVRATVALTLSSVPPADAYVGERFLGRTPGRFQLPRSAEPVAIELRAAGHRSRSVSFLPSEDGEVSAELTRLPRAPRGPRTSPDLEVPQ